MNFKNILWSRGTFFIFGLHSISGGGLLANGLLDIDPVAWNNVSNAVGCGTSVYSDSPLGQKDQIHADLEQLPMMHNLSV